MKTRVLRVRLPVDHWIWNEANKSEIVRLALDWYKDLPGEVAVVRRAVEEIKTALAGGVNISSVASRESQGDEGGVTADPRLRQAIEKFLDF